MILQKMIESHKYWYEKLPYDLLGYETSICTSHGVTSNSLVYGMAAVIPIKIKIPLLRILKEGQIWMEKERYKKLALWDDKIL